MQSVLIRAVMIFKNGTNVYLPTWLIFQDEAYSPSRPMTPPPIVPLSDISLPSNLQEILATIKQRTEATGVTGDVDMRTTYPQ